MQNFFYKRTLLLSGLVVSAASYGHGLRAAEVYVQAGDVSARSAVVWGRCNSEQDSYLMAEASRASHDGFAETVDFRDTSRLREKMEPLVVKVDEASDYAGQVTFRGLRPGSRYDYRVTCAPRPAAGLPVAAETAGEGTFRTAPEARDADQTVRFVWGADLAGQGWGRNPELTLETVDGNTVKGGYVIFDVMRRMKPDFAVFQGDMIYADNAIAASKAIPPEVGGGIWINEPAKDFVALSLDEYRANWKYNLGDRWLRRFLGRVPVYVQWDDHEVTNNWYPGEILTADPYNSVSADLLAERSKQALFEYNPIDGQVLFRRFAHGPHMELFLLDERTYRGPNPENTDANGIEMLGHEQFQWLKQGLKASEATWKVISTHDPLSIVTGGPGDYDAWAQDDPQVLGREVQLSRLLQFVKDEDIRNVVFITSDVHFTAAVSYLPERAVFSEFSPFWEFVIGPIHAGAFGPGALDPSFGPEYEYVRAPDTEGLSQNLPPLNLQSFGLMKIDGEGILTVKLVDVTGSVLFIKSMSPL